MISTFPIPLQHHTSPVRWSVCSLEPFPTPSRRPFSRHSTHWVPPFTVLVGAILAARKLASCCRGKGARARREGVCIYIYILIYMLYVCVVCVCVCHFQGKDHSKLIHPTSNDLMQPHSMMYRICTDCRGVASLIPSTAQRRRWFETVTFLRDALGTYLRNFNCPSFV